MLCSFAEYFGICPHDVAQGAGISAPLELDEVGTAPLFAYLNSSGGSPNRVCGRCGGKMPDAIAQAATTLIRATLRDRGFFRITISTS